MGYEFVKFSLVLLKMPSVRSMVKQLRAEGRLDEEKFKEKSKIYFWLNIFFITTALLGVLLMYMTLGTILEYPLKILMVAYWLVVIYILLLSRKGALYLEYFGEETVASVDRITNGYLTDPKITFKIFYTFHVGDKTYSNSRMYHAKDLAKLTDGKTVKIRYNPDFPEMNTFSV